MKPTSSLSLSSRARAGHTMAPDPNPRIWEVRCEHVETPKWEGPSFPTGRNGQSGKSTSMSSCHSSYSRAVPSYLRYSCSPTVLLLFAHWMLVLRFSQDWHSLTGSMHGDHQCRPPWKHRAHDRTTTYCTRLWRNIRFTQTISTPKKEQECSFASSMNIGSTAQSSPSKSQNAPGPKTHTD